MSIGNASRFGRLTAEFLLIVLGVLVALAIDSWNASRFDRAVEADYLGRIYQDLAATRQSIEDMLALRDAVAEHGSAVLAVLEGDAPFPSDTLGFLASLYTATRADEPRIVDFAFRDLVSTGNLRLVRDPDLRAALVDFYWSFEWYGRFDYESDKAEYRARVRSVLPVDFQVAARPCETASVLTCSASLPGVAATELVGQFMSDEDLPDALRLALQAVAINDFRPQLVKVDALITELSVPR
jgi:hypothetical protein